MKHLVICLIPLLFVLSSCEKATKKLKEDYKPVARAEIGELILVMDSGQWNNELGDEIRHIFRSPMRGLPQDEPLFDLNKVNPLKFNRVFQSATNLIFIVTLDQRTEQSRAIRDYFTDNSLKMIQRDTTLFMTVRKDEFAKGQIALFLFSQTEDLLLDFLAENREKLREIFETAARERMRDKILKAKETALMKALKEDHGYEIQIPLGWDLAKDLPNFTWLRALEANSEKNIFIYSQPYTSQEIFNDIGEFRDQITEKYLRDSQKPALYVNRQEIVPVFTERVNYNGNFAVEARGLWKISDSSGGGPFVSYTIVDEESKKVYYVEGYVYSPGTKKRDLVREVESVITTFKTPSDLSEEKNS